MGKKKKKALNKILINFIKDNYDVKVKDIVRDYYMNDFDDEDDEKVTKLKFNPFNNQSKYEAVDFCKEFIYGFVNNKKSIEMFDDNYVRLLIKRFILSSLYYEATESDIKAIKIFDVCKNIKTDEIKFSVNVEYDADAKKALNPMATTKEKTITCFYNFAITIAYNANGIKELTIYDQQRLYSCEEESVKIKYEIIDNK